jgi:hypothetical protein
VVNRHVKNRTPQNKHRTPQTQRRANAFALPASVEINNTSSMAFLRVITDTKDKLIFGAISGAYNENGGIGGLTRNEAISVCFDPCARSFSAHANGSIDALTLFLFETAF